MNKEIPDKLKFKKKARMAILHKVEFKASRKLKRDLL